MRNAIFLLFLIFSAVFGIKTYAENDAAKPYLNLNGYISDATTGEMLIGATVYITELSAGAATNVYGYYSIRLDAGNYQLTYSYIGYESRKFQLSLKSDTTLNIKLIPQGLNLNEVVITGESFTEQISRAQMGVAQLDIKNIRQIPAFMGEVDIIKALQLLPGVQATSEGGSGFSVRGGSPDQNLILLDEALVYNPSHLMGFFSVFNNDAVKGVELFKGDIPAEYGGRLSSVVDVRMNEGNSQRLSGQGGIGTISSRLKLEGPIQKDKSSFMLAGRRTYADLFLAISPDEKIRDNKLYFYDFNGKANYTFNDRNRIFITGYFGKDVFKNENFALGWGNQTFTLRWNHLFSSKIFSNFSLIYSRFNYELGVPEGQANAFNWSSQMKDYSLKSDFTWFASASNTLKFGFQSTFHSFNPGTAEGIGDETAFNKIEVAKSFALESGLYVSNEQKIGSRLTLKYGLRLSLFNNIGKGTIYEFDNNYHKVDSVVYPSGEVFQNFMNLEPRFSMAYKLDEFSSVKAAYTRNVQYVHLAQNSTAGTPLDIWFPSSPNVKPQLGDQFSLGYFRYFPKEKLETSVEGFYKLNHNAIDFKDHAELLLNEVLEGELRFGEAWSYGLEFLVRLNEGRLNGWVSYTWSRTFRKIPEINNGNPYPASYDKPHDISLVANYQLSKRISLGANWVYATGSAVTFPTGRFTIGNSIAPVYSDRNAYRLPDYHRLDLSISLKNKDKSNRKWRGEWNLSIYNAYYRKNPWVINFVADTEQSNVTKAEMTYLFGIVPAITYNFKF
ncbi:MAG: TonB-dependent receptor [Bacteroidales bacterium]|nr:TonB-dependent receptor [Bacteroidales bacterium]